MAEECYFFTASCICPCAVLGSIQTMTSRELPYDVSLYCPSQLCQLGPTGCETCGLISMLYLLACPCLPVHVMRERTRISTVYSEDKIRLSDLNFWSYIPTCVCFPYNLMEQYKFILEMKKQDCLVFDYDLKNYQDFKNKPDQDFITKKVFLLGPYCNAKTELFQKLLKHCELKDSVTTGTMNTMEQNDEGEVRESEGGTNSNKVAPTDKIVTEDVLSEKHRTKMGIKSFIRINGTVYFLEIWCVPPSELHSFACEINLPHSTVAIFVFDGCDGDRIAQQQSFSDMQDMFIETIDHHPTRKFCVCVNHNEKPKLVQTNTSSNLTTSNVNIQLAASPKSRAGSVSAGQVSPTRHQSMTSDDMFPIAEPPAQFSMDAALKWAENCGLDFVKVNTVYNSGVVELSQTIVDLILEK